MSRKWIVAVLVLVVCALLVIAPLGFFVMLTGVVGGKMKEAGQAAAQPCSPTESQDAAAIAGTGGGTVLPVRGVFVYSSEFGMRLHPVVHQWKLHAGMDLAMIPHGGTIVAARDGKVQAAKPNNGSAGNMLVLDHGAGLTTTYMHLAKFSVTQGESVKAGQQIGVEGATGRVTGAHLHFEVRVNGKPTDPRAWLTARGVKVPRLNENGVGVGDVHPDPAASNASASSAPTSSTAASSSSSPASPTPSATAGGSATATGKAVTASLPARVGEYQGEQIRNAAHIIQAGRRLKLDDRTITLGLMTAMGESDLVNVDHGDQAGPDSRGIFQQRNSWGTEAERMNPSVAATKFFQALMRVKGYRTMTPTLAAHATQANQDPYHYAPHWPSAVKMMAALTDNPALEQDLGGSDPASGSSAPCITSGQEGASVPAGELPPGPEGACPATTSPGEKGLQPTALRMLRCGAAKFTKVKTFYGIGDRVGRSDHPAGRAVDFMIDDYRTPQGRAYGWQLATWMRTHAVELGIKYVIWDVKIWRVGDPDWRVYTRYGPTPSDNLGHRNHVHVSVK